MKTIGITKRKLNKKPQKLKNRWTETVIFCIYILHTSSDGLEHLNSVASQSIATSETNLEGMVVPAILPELLYASLELVFFDDLSLHDELVQCPRHATAGGTQRRQPRVEPPLIIQRTTRQLGG